ncbi:MAG: hypothetical protein J5U17_03345 [Candidatus Methanoperedens sp.]|nr:hypothetical protein [Candidatus Methanoperedens sp.]MCE8427068.1 hypothetical protein [Candidatus Methanoperedens sp.]
MKSEIVSISNQNLRAAKSDLMNGIDSFSLLSSIWTEIRNDRDKSKIRKKGVN